LRKSPNLPLNPSTMVVDSDNPEESVFVVPVSSEILIEGENSGSSSVNLRLYGIPASSKAASIGAREREPAKFGFETNSIGCLLLIASLEKIWIGSLTEEKISCSIRGPTLVRLGAGTNHY